MTIPYPRNARSGTLMICIRLVIIPRTASARGTRAVRHDASIMGLNLRTSVDSPWRLRRIGLLKKDQGGGRSTSYSLADG
jgi:hypothetical protein